ncbi:putative ribonuclease H domain, reverse transcriptase zinc-binding domain-containing protein [Arabidopsis thaliana]
MKLSSTATSDLLGWHYTKSGEYTVKSGYWLNTHSPGQQNDFVPPPGLLEFKEAIWKLQTAPKLRHFLWRIITNTLAIGSNLTRRKIIIDPQCKRCCAAEETLDHLFFGCQYAQAIWRGSQVSNTSFFDATLSFDDKLKIILQCCNNRSYDNLTRQTPLWILWRIWKSRNLLVHQRRDSLWYKDVQQAITDAYEWIPEINHTQSQRSLTSTKTAWQKPPPGSIKCNYDCNYLCDDIESKAGWIIRDANGYYIEATQSKGFICTSPLEAELQALLMAMQHVWIKGYRGVIFEGDNSSVKELIIGKARNFALHNLIREVQHWKKRFTQVEFH